MKVKFVGDMETIFMPLHLTILQLEWTGPKMVLAIAILLL